MIALDNSLGQNKNESPAMAIMSMLISPLSFLQGLRFALLQHYHHTAVFNFFFFPTVDTSVFHHLCYFLLFSLTVLLK